MLLFRSRKARSKSTNAVVEAATLMRWCEDWLPHEKFSNLNQTQFRAIAKLLHFTKVGFVLHWLDNATGRPELAERSQEILTNFQIIFDPDAYGQPRSEEQTQIAKFLAELAAKAFSLVELERENEPPSPTYFLKIREWCTEWLTFAIENDNEVSEIYDQVGLRLTAVLLGELAEIRKALAVAVQKA